MNRQRFVAFLLLMIIHLPLSAEIEIVITSGMDSARPVAVLPFTWTGRTETPPHDVASIVASDLRRSGRFNPMDRHDLVQTVDNYAALDLEAWRKKGIEAVVVGTVEEQPDGKVKISYELVDVFLKPQGTQGVANLTPNRLDAYAVTVDMNGLRFEAHRVSDRIYFELTGMRGAFATKLAYVSVDKSLPKPYRLMVSDSDGFDSQAVWASNEAIMSPAWSPDAKKLAYVSFENGRSEVYVQELFGAKARQKVASFIGINSAPAFSPDGRMLALTLSRDGNPEIYILDINSNRYSRITHSNYSIETEPGWFPDGQFILFTSDRGRGPQIYKQHLASGAAERMTWESNYNASGSITPDGKTMVMISRVNGVYHVAVQDLETNNVQILTKTTLDESPSLAPNGSMVIYATVYGNRQVLSVVSTDGRFKARLPSKKGIVKAPVWSPYIE
ncbi:MAG: Tol-Pal system beta propeller repeat protein TolB [Gammaproteobacteria bacterium]|nr:Tol-Pal system beta propeller repeat protein TolB [Gammaproteobacteria bacterium]MDH5629855.1 Tol-Pal system beta propeller repeat protein TolB [Gammaproteobacteria bacterium]